MAVGDTSSKRARERPQQVSLHVDPRPPHARTYARTHTHAHIHTYTHTSTHKDTSWRPPLPSPPNMPSATLHHLQPHSSPHTTSWSVRRPHPRSPVAWARTEERAGDGGGGGGGGWTCVPPAREDRERERERARAPHRCGRGPEGVWTWTGRGGQLRQVGGGRNGGRGTGIGECCRRC